MPTRRNDGSQGLSRGLRLIEFLTDYPQGCPLAKIAESTGTNKSTTHRTLKALMHMGYVMACKSPGTYRLTSRFVSIGYKTYSSLNIISVAAAHLERLNMDTGDTVLFSKLEGNHSVLLYKLEPTEGMLRTRSYIGQQMALYCSAMGKVYLAHTPDPFLERYWKKEGKRIVKITSNTIVDLGVMRYEAAQIRAEGISRDREENEIGVKCLGAPIFDLYGRVNYAVALSLPMSRLDAEREQRLAERIRETAAAISAEIGGPAGGGPARPEIRRKTFNAAKSTRRFDN